MDIRKFKLSCLGSPKDERDIFYSDVASVGENVTIPESFEVFYQFAPKNQGEISSCVAHSLSEYKEIVNLTNELFSVGFIYGNRSDSDFQGQGMIIREALAHLVNDGDVLNRDFPINEEYPNILDTIQKYGKNDLLTKASQYKSKGYLQLNVQDIKKYLVTEKKPLIIAVRVYENFYDLQNNKGLIPSVPSGKCLGGHCMLITGYDKDTLKILNSWGTYGDNGYVHLDLNSSIIKEVWGLTDNKINPVTPTVVTTIYRVQLGAFRVKENAFELADELRTKGLDCCIKVYPDMYKVQCGVFKIKDNAYALQNKIKALGYDAFVITEQQ